MELTDELDTVLGEVSCVELALELRDRSDPEEVVVVDAVDVVEERVVVVVVVVDRVDFILVSLVEIRSTLNEEGKLYCL